MPVIRNSQLIKKFTDFFKLKSHDFLDSEAGRMLVPVITHPILPKLVTLNPTEAQMINGDIRVPAGKKWKLINLFVQWTSDANAGNREIALEIFDPISGFDYAWVASRNLQPASLTRKYNFAPGVDSVGSGSAEFQTIAVPDMILLPGTQLIVFDNTPISAGDTAVSTVVYVAEEDIMEDEHESLRPL